jgi:hypothetical protein
MHWQALNCSHDKFWVASQGHERGCSFPGVSKWSLACPPMHPCIRPGLPRGCKPDGLGNDTNDQQDYRI